MVGEWLGVALPVAAIGAVVACVFGLGMGGRR